MRFSRNDDNNTNYDDAMSLSLDGNKLYAGSPQAISDISCINTFRINREDTRNIHVQESRIEMHLS